MSDRIRKGGQRIINNMGMKKVVRRSAVVGGLGSIFLALFYLLVVWIASRSWDHSVDLIIQDRYYVGAIAGGLGIQVGLFYYVRRVQKMLRTAGASAVTAAGTGSSTVSMVACCLHHVGDVLPVIGASGAAIFLDQYRYPVMLIGIAVNMLGIYLMLRIIGKNRLWPSLLQS